MVWLWRILRVATHAFHSTSVVARSLVSIKFGIAIGVVAGCINSEQQIPAKNDKIKATHCERVAIGRIIQNESRGEDSSPANIFVGGRPKERRCLLID